MIGKKRPLLDIGKTKMPRRLINVKNIPVDYCNNNNSWMTSNIFETWLRKWDKKAGSTVLDYNYC